MSDEKPEEQAQKHPGGAPSKYKPEYEQMLIDHMAKGFSFVSFQAIAGVCEDTLHDWVKKHPGWKEAKDKAFAECLLFWEKAGIDGLYDITEYDEKSGKPISKKSLNSTVWIFNMKNRHKWRDKQKDESDVIVNNNTTNVSALSDEELDEKYQKLQEKYQKLQEKK
jgi:hypothetical protein